MPACGHRIVIQLIQRLRILCCDPSTALRNETLTKLYYEAYLRHIFISIHIQVFKFVYYVYISNYWWKPAFSLEDREDFIPSLANVSLVWRASAYIGHKCRQIRMLPKTRPDRTGTHAWHETAAVSDIAFLTFLVVSWQTLENADNIQFFEFVCSLIFLAVQGMTPIAGL